MLPSTAKPKTQVRLNLSLLDANGNLAVPTEMVLSLEAIGQNVEVPQEVVFTIADGSTKEVALNVTTEGFFHRLIWWVGQLLLGGLMLRRTSWLPWDR